MKKTIVGLIAVALIAPLSLFAYTDCRDARDGWGGCTTAGLLEVSNQTFLSTGDRVAALQELVKRLLAQIAAVKSAPVNPTRAGISPALTRNLIIGSSDSLHDDEVLQLQLFLTDQGLYTGPATGYYGNLTAAAVMKWQKAHGMDFVTLKSGVGPMTRAKIAESCSTSMVITGEYEYSDMAGFSSFRTTNGPFAAPASIITKTKQASGIPEGTMSEFPLHDSIVGTLRQLGDTCTLVIEATVEVSNPQKTGLTDRQGIDVVSADFVRLVSKGRVFDNCNTFDGLNNTFVKTQRPQ